LTILLSNYPNAKLPIEGADYPYFGKNPAILSLFDTWKLPFAIEKAVIPCAIFMSACRTDTEFALLMDVGSSEKSRPLPRPGVTAELPPESFPDVVLLYCSRS
jgi:hypothetical protein